MRRVRIYVSYSQKDETLRAELVDQIKAAVHPYSIDFLSAKSIPLGYSRKAYIRENLLKSDIILLLVTKNYSKHIFTDLPFGEFSGDLQETHAFVEYSAITDYPEKIIIPIYFDLVNKLTFPAFLSDRSGVNVAFSAAELNTYDTILHHILPIIESKIQEKAAMDLVV